MLEKKHLVFLAGATAPFAPPLCTALYLYIVLWRNWVVLKNIHTPFPWKIPLRIQSKISEDSNMILTKDLSKILSKILLKILYNPN